MSSSKGWMMKLLQPLPTDFVSKKETRFKNRTKTTDKRIAYKTVMKKKTDVILGYLKNNYILTFLKRFCIQRSNK